MGRSREKLCTDDYLALSISVFKKHLALSLGKQIEISWSRGGEVIAAIGVMMESPHSVRLKYQRNADGKEAHQYNYPVSITWTPCSFGGQRAWFMCPRCDRRVGKLYSGELFACRHCMRLNYSSQQLSKHDALLEQARNLRHKLGFKYGFLDFPPECIERPKGMHRKTFAKHIEKLERMENVLMADISSLIAHMQRLG